MLVNKLYVTPCINVTFRERLQKDPVAVHDAWEKFKANLLDGINESFRLAFYEEYKGFSCGSFSIMSPPFLSNISDSRINPIYVNDPECYNNNVTCIMMQKAIGGFYESYAYTCVSLIENVVCGTNCSADDRYWSGYFCDAYLGDSFRNATDPTDRAMETLMCPSNVGDIFKFWANSLAPYRCIPGWNRHCFDSPWRDNCMA